MLSCMSVLVWSYPSFSIVCRSNASANSDIKVLLNTKPKQQTYPEHEITICLPPVQLLSKCRRRVNAFLLRLPALNEPFACLRTFFFAVIRLQIHRQRNYNPRYSVKLSVRSLHIKLDGESYK